MNDPKYPPGSDEPFDADDEDDEQRLQAFAHQIEVPGGKRVLQEDYRRG